MKVLMLSTNDIQGGAARAANRLHQGLQQLGVRSEMLVQSKTSDDPAVHGPQTLVQRVFSRLRGRLDRLPLKLYRDRRPAPYHLQWLPERLHRKVARLNADVVHLHWICGGFLRPETLSKLKKPMVWTLHDKWPFTGGCHLSGKCDRYGASCGACPQLGSQRDRDLSRWVWKRKACSWRGLDMTIVSPSRWLAECARSSTLFKSLPVVVIPNGIDTSRFKPIDRAVARGLLNLPRDKKLILFGAMNATGDPNKGFSLLAQALESLCGSRLSEEVELIVFGASRSPDSPAFNFPSHYLGKLADDLALAVIYNAADVFVCPSMEEAFGLTILEAMACGTPCVAFHIGGVSDIIDDGQAGYLARPFEVEDLARGIQWVLEDEERRKSLSRSARQKVEQEFDLRAVSQRYLELYESLLSREGCVQDQSRMK